LIPPLSREEILEQNVIKDFLCDEVGSQMIRARIEQQNWRERGTALQQQTKEKKRYSEFYSSYQVVPHFYINTNRYSSIFPERKFR
jgi:hypothetical protein